MVLCWSGCWICPSPFNEHHGVDKPNLGGNPDKAATKGTFLHVVGSRESHSSKGGWLMYGTLLKRVPFKSSA